MAENESRLIVAGPSREELFDALKYRHEGRKIEITVAPSHITGRTLASGRKFVPGNLKFGAVVEQITASVGNEYVWHFLLSDVHESLGTRSVKGWIDTTTRRGRVLNVPNSTPRHHFFITRNP